MNFLAAGKTYVTISYIPILGDGSPEIKRIRVGDVATYYRTQANSMSGCREIAGIVGDWRPIDHIARACLDYFKEVNPEGMRRAARKVGLVPKF